MVATNKANIGTSPDERAVRTTYADLTASTITALTDSSGGTAGNTIANVAAGGDMEDVSASLAGKINELVTAVADLQTRLNAVTGSN